MVFYLRFFYTILSSILLALSIPNEILILGSPFIGIFSLCPFYIAVNKSNKCYEIFLLSFIHGIITHILSSFWLGNFSGFAIFTLGASALGTGIFEGLFSAAFLFPNVYKRRFSNNYSFLQKTSSPLMKIFWFAGIYTVWEYCKSTGFLAYPWGTLSMTAYKWSAITQIADITGVYGITFLFATFSALVGEACILLGELRNSDYDRLLLNSYKKALAIFTVLLAFTFIYGMFQIIQKRSPVKTMNTILVQQNRNPNRRQEEKNIRVAKKITKVKLSEYKDNNEKCDLVVWSEAVLSQRFPAAELYYNLFPTEEPLVKFIRKNNTPFIIGGPVVLNADNHEFGNSALLFDSKGKFSGYYSKMHLVPFAELIPFREYEIIRKIIKRMIGFSYGWTPGKEAVIFEIPLKSNIENNKESNNLSSDLSKNENLPSAKISTPICFDDSAHEVCKALFLAGSEVFVNITNDSWSKTDSAEIQHFVVAHYRSIEYRTTTIRCTNAGYTAVISPTGKILADLPLFTEDALSYKVPIFERKMTIYAQLGDWLPYTILFFMFFHVLLAVIRNKNNFY